MFINIYIHLYIYVYLLYTNICVILCVYTNKTVFTKPLNEGNQFKLIISVNNQLPLKESNQTNY